MEYREKFELLSGVWGDLRGGNGRKFYERTKVGNSSRAMLVEVKRVRGDNGVGIDD